MRVFILDRITRHNLLLFKHLMQRMKEKEFKELVNKTFRIYIHCKTGELSLLGEEKQIEPRQWKPLFLKWDDGCGQSPLQIIESGEGEAFYYGDLKAEALHRLADTIKVLNHVAFDPTHRGMLNRMTSQHAIASLEVEQEIDHPFIEKAWYDVSREGAEKLLIGHPVGTYLFRKGEFAEILENNLNRISSQPVTCFSLIFTDAGDKISEKVIIFKNEKWLFYDDDPHLKDISYPTLQDLLGTIGHQLHTPLTMA